MGGSRRRRSSILYQARYVSEGLGVGRRQAHLSVICEHCRYMRIRNLFDESTTFERPMAGGQTCRMGVSAWRGCTATAAGISELHCD